MNHNERDPRWEDVHAYVGPIQGYLYDEDTDVRNWVEILIEVTLDGTVFYQKQLIHKDDLDLANFDIFKFILNEMVNMIDDRIKEKDQ